MSSSSALTKRGLALAKARGVKLGNPNNLPFDAHILGSKYGARTREINAFKFAISLVPIIEELRTRGIISATGTAKELNKLGIKTSWGNTWQTCQVQRLLKTQRKQEPELLPLIKKNSDYRATCFQYHNKKCAVCEEKLVLTVHHYDENRENNNPENLIPLCYNHHEYIHSEHAYLIVDELNRYRDNFIAGL